MCYSPCVSIENGDRQGSGAGVTHSLEEQKRARRYTRVVRGLAELRLIAVLGVLFTFMYTRGSERLRTSCMHVAKGNYILRAITLLARVSGRTYYRRICHQHFGPLDRTSLSRIESENLVLAQGLRQKSPIAVRYGVGVGYLNLYPDAPRRPALVVDKLDSSRHDISGICLLLPVDYYHVVLSRGTTQRRRASFSAHCSRAESWSSAIWFLRVADCEEDHTRQCVAGRLGCRKQGVCVGHSAFHVHSGGDRGLNRSRNRSLRTPRSSQTLGVEDCRVLRDRVCD